MAVRVNLDGRPRAQRRQVRYRHQTIEQMAGHGPVLFQGREPAADPQHQLIKFPPLAIQVHAEASGHRTIFCCPHTFGSSGGGRITSTASTRCPHHEVSLEY